MENVPPATEVARYAAVVTNRLEESSVAINSEVSAELAARAILTPPQWSLRAWAAPAPEDAVFETDQLEEWALHKFRALFDFAAVLPDGSADEMEVQLLERFPMVDASRHASTAVPRYKRIQVHSEILENGDAQWGYDLPEAGELPPGLPGVYVSDPGSPLDMNGLADGHALDLDVFVQNMARIDIQRRLETR
ncbi:MAG: hypothetical protein ACRDZ3_10130 [Acidimicrobiia bacterium]